MNESSNLIKKFSEKITFQNKMTISISLIIIETIICILLNSGSIILLFFSMIPLFLLIMPKETIKNSKILGILCAIINFVCNIVIVNMIFDSLASIPLLSFGILNLFACSLFFIETPNTGIKSFNISTNYDSVKYCIKCGQIIDKNSQFCNRCGEKQ